MRVGLAAIVMLGLAGAAQADPAKAVRPMSESARPYFDRGAAAYAAGDYAEAIDVFERGQRLDAHPDFLYALAQAYRKQGDCVRAIALYQAFLATRPPDDEASRARANLERCPLAPAEPNPANPRPVNPPPANPPANPRPVNPPPSLGSTTASSSAGPNRETPSPAPQVEPWYADVTGGVLAGAGVLGLGVGTTYLILSDKNLARANQGPVLGDAERLTDSASRDRQIGAWCLVGGGALAVGAIARYALHRRSSAAADRTVWLRRTGDGVVVSWGGGW
ncbi:MAG: tetratricopeptide repeat-containing protein [Deltaproteobacteria bacterium]|nr:MAG: tetratricopeptide repeat-containing protein [Deltaproteobacteria bacterium]TMQ11759.1 MAG: tetratricopeptide repeat-containing protein [Deltaproteobacteria bacterium]